MPETIRDGTGTGNLTRVDDDNHLHVTAVSYSGEHFINHRKKQAYNFLFDVTPTGTDDEFIYIKNTSTSLDLVLEGITFRVGSAEQVKMYQVSGIPVGGATITPINLTIGHTNAADGIFLSGNNITGLTIGNLFEHLFITSTESKHFNFDQDIILPPNAAIALSVVTGGIQINGTIVFNYHREA